MKLNTVLFWTILTGIFLIALTPFVVINGLFFPFITGKAYFFRILVEIIFILWAILAIRDKSFIPRVSYLLWSFVSFISVMFIADLFGSNRIASFWSNFERMEGWALLVHLMAYFTVIISVLRKAKHWFYLLNLWLLSTAVMIFYSFLQIAGKFTIHQGGLRVDGTLGNATYLAVFMLFGVFIALILSLKTENIKLKIGYGILIFFQIIILFYTSTRGAILGLVGGLILTSILVAIFNKENFILRKIAIYFLVAIFSFVLLFISARDADFIKNNNTLNRIASISLEDKTTLSRFIIWDIAWEGVKQKPILGWGQSNFNLVFDRGYDHRLYDQEQWFDRAHNVIFDWLIAGGFLGLISYLSILVFALIYIWRSSLGVTEKSVLTGLLAAYFFQNLFVFDNLVSYILYVSVLGYVHFSYVGERDSSLESKDSLVKNVLSVSLLILIPFVVYFVNIPSINSSKDLIQGMRLRITGEERLLATVHGTPTNHLEFFKKAIGRNTFGNAEIRVQLMQTAGQVQLASNVNAIEKEKFVSSAIDEMKKQIIENPDDAKFLFVLGTFYGQIGDYENAAFYLEEALRNSASKPIIVAPLIQSYARLGKEQEAFEIAKDLYEKEKRSEDSWRLYVNLALRLGRTDLVDELVNESKEIGEVYRVVHLLEDLIKINQNNPQMYISLASGYAEVGDIENAIKTLEEFKIAFPNLSVQGDQFINQIKNSASILAK